MVVAAFQALFKQGTKHKEPGTRQRRSSTKHQAQRTKHAPAALFNKAQRTKHAPAALFNKAPSTKDQARASGALQQSTKHKEPSTRQRLSSTKHQAQRTRHAAQPHQARGIAAPVFEFDLVNWLVNFVSMEIPISEFKAKCIQLIKSAAENEEELVVTLRGKPLAKVTRIPITRARVLGGQRDAVAGGFTDEVLVKSDFENDWT